MRINPPGLRSFVALLLVAASLTFAGGVVAERWGANAPHAPEGDEEHAAAPAAGEADEHGAATPAGETHQAITDESAADPTSPGEAHQEPAGAASESHPEATAADDHAEEPDEHAAAGTVAAGSTETHDEGAGEQADSHAAVEHTFLGVNTWSNGFLVAIVAVSVLLAAALAWRPHPTLLLGVIAFSLVFVAFDLDAAFTATDAGGFPVPLGALTAILHLGAAALAALVLAERRASALAPEHA